MTPAPRAFARPSGTRRGVAALAAAALTSAISFVLVAPAQSSTTKVPGTQPLVALLQDHVARSAPSAGAVRIESVHARRPLTRVRTVLPVLGQAVSSAGRPWLQVRLPGRPNGHSGWIRASGIRRSSTEWHITVSLAARRVTVFRNGHVVRRFPAVIGAPSTPTPRGQYFVEEALELSPEDAGGPFALATSARSQVLQSFGGGPGQIGLHGTNNLWEPMGSAASHGCVRVDGGAITWLVRRIGAGVPLTISR